MAGALPVMVAGASRCACASKASTSSVLTVRVTVWGWGMAITPDMPEPGAVAGLGWGTLAWVGR